MQEHKAKQRRNVWASVALIAIGAAAAYGQPTKEYIYLGDRILAVDVPASTITVSPLTIAASANGGPQNITITGSGAWVASSAVSWITITSGATGNGNGSVVLQIAPNTGALRSGTVTVNSRGVTITQGAGSVMANPSILEFANTGGTNAITVTAAAGVAWIITTGDAWLQASPSSGTGTGAGQTVQVTAAAASTDRAGSLSVSGNIVTVNQWAAIVRPLTASSSGGSGGTTTFTFSMAGGASAHSLLVLFNQAIEGNQTCFLNLGRVTPWIGLSPSTNSGGWLGAGYGNPGFIENSSCRVNTQTATVIQNGPN